MAGNDKPTFGLDGYVPVQKGYQPRAQANPGNVQGGHVPTTGQGGSGPGTPPNQGSGGKK